MLRRTARVLRVLLLVLGVVTLLWMPFSFRWAPTLLSPWPMCGANLDSHRGVARLFVVERTGGPSQGDVYLFLFDSPLTSLAPNSHVWPQVQRDSTDWSGTTTISLPLWLLAAVCLAWPVTSLIVARRRRRGRGFEVEARDQMPEATQTPDTSR